METTWIISIIGIVGGIITWLYNEIQKRKLKVLSEKEKRYENLIRLIRSLGEAVEGSNKGNEFIVEFQLCWMYCPDIVIEKGNKFLDSMNPSIVEKNQQNIDERKGEFILELRKDLLKNTKLKSNDFRDVRYSTQTTNKE